MPNLLAQTLLSAILQQREDSDLGLQREQHINFIMDRCAHLRNLIEASSALNMNSLNVISENFFRDLLNLLLGLKLKNLNMVLANAAAIDLGDGPSKFCVQITATSDIGKIKKTVEKFEKKALHKTYDRLVVFITTKKKKYKTREVHGKNGDFKIDLKKDVWDWTEIQKRAADLNLAELSQLRDFFEKEIVIPSTKVPVSEVGTFIDLMHILSDETHIEAGKGELDEPDPDKKIGGRFSDHSDYLLNAYTDHYIEYGAVLDETIKKGDLGTARMRRLGLHLGTKSNSYLRNCSGNPEKALDDLVDFYVKALLEHGRESSESAVRFFMLDQMIKCHVFPNKKAANG